MTEPVSFIALYTCLSVFDDEDDGLHPCVEKGLLCGFCCFCCPFTCVVDLLTYPSRYAFHYY